MTPELHALKKKTIDEMIHYMRYGGADDENDPDYDPSFNAGYTHTHVDRCSMIIDELFAALGKVAGHDRNKAILQAAESAVTALNELNRDCGESLIETVERENLCELINRAAREAGLQQTHDDITFDWRDW